jgi:ADP-ribose pyrophosphatase YjhB (NUDIX family)
MKLQEFKAQVPHPLRVVTLVLLRREGQVLLALKGRDFGEGMWNGYGGKVKDSETVWKCAGRETQEEAEVQVHWLRRKAYLNFYFGAVPIEDGWNQQVQVFECGSWSGTPKETEEMHCPTWFAEDKLPLERMWQFDRLWMPKVLAGEKFAADFLFGEGNQPLEHKFFPYPS